MIRQTTDKYLIRYLDSEIFPGEDPVDLRGRFWVARVGGEPVAFAGLQVEGRDVYFHRAGVLPKARGRGLQADLIRRRLAWARAQNKSRAVTYTVADNVPSANNLIRTGFQLYRPAFPWAGEDEVLYWYRVL